LLRVGQNAPDAHAAAQYYPPGYWHSLLKLRPKSDYHGVLGKRNGISENVKSQDQWFVMLKAEYCDTCNQLGNLATRTLPASLGHFNSPVEFQLRPNLLHIAFLSMKRRTVIDSAQPFPGCASEPSALFLSSKATSDDEPESSL
jgi:hypothetical protein